MEESDQSVVKRMAEIYQWTATKIEDFSRSAAKSGEAIISVFLDDNPDSTIARALSLRD